MAEYKCDQCDREFTNAEYMDLDRVRVDPDNPRTGYHSVCECGAEFWVDNWRRVDTVEVDGEGITVSTVFLILNHGRDGEDLWYETLAYGQVERRYETKAEAEAGHAEIVDRLESGAFRFEPTGKRLVIDDD